MTDIRWHSPAGADLTGLRGSAVTLDASGNIVTTANPANVLGFLITEGTTGQQVEIMLLGITRVVSAGAIAIGDRLTNSGNRKVSTTAGATDIIVGRALSAATGADQYIWAYVSPTGCRRN